MIKVRVYEVARELGLDNRELVNKIASLGIQVRNHMSALEPAEVERIKRSLDKEKQANLVAYCCRYRFIGCCLYLDFSNSG